MVSRFKKFLGLTISRLFVGFVKILPVRLQVLIKSNLVVMEKLDSEKCEIFLNIESDVEYSTRLRSCAKEPEMTAWFEAFFKEGDVFYDIGANVGAYSLIAAHLFDGKVKVYAFEPGFPNFSQLSKNIYINKSGESIVPLQVALSDQTGISVFNYNNLVAGGALHALDKAVDYKGDMFEPIFKQEVISFRLDDFIRFFNIPAPNHVKVDVDGIELKILKGADKTLRRSELKTLMIEINEAMPEAKNIIEFLENIGFFVHSKHRYGAGGDSGAASGLFNYLFRK